MPQASRARILRHIHQLTAAQAAGGLSDAELLGRFAARRDEGAFAALLERHGPLVLGVCRRVLRHEPDVEDAFQATFLVLARKAASIRRRESVASWLHRVARHLAVKARVRSARRQAREGQLEDVPAPASGDELTWRELSAALDEELQRLPEKYRAPLVLCCLEGKARDEAARELGWTVGAVKGCLQRGRELLRARLARRGLALPAALLAALLARPACAAVPALLAVGTVRGALAAGTGAAGSVTVRAAALAEAALPAAMSGRLKAVAALVLALALVGTAAGLLAPQAAPPPPPPGPAPAARPAADKGQPQPAPAPAEGRDAHGDPLPPGALARFGTVRLRHGDRIYALALSRDGKLLASTDASGHIRLWDPATGKALHRLRDGRSVFSAALSPDGKRLATGGQRDVVLWDTATGKEVRRLQGMNNATMAVAFSPDGKLLASGSHDNKVRLWDMVTGQPPRVLEGHTRNVYCVAFSSDGTTLASGGTGKTVRLWDVATARQRATLTGHRDRVRALSFSPDGKRLASASEDVTVCIWDVAAGKPTLHLRGVRWDNWIYGVAFTPDGKGLLTSGHFDGAVRLWDAGTGKEVRCFPARQRDNAVLALSADGRVLAAGGSNGVVRLWDLATGREHFPGRGHDAGLWTLAFSPDGKTLAAGGANEPISLWGVGSGRRLQAGGGKRVETRFVAFSPDGKTLVSADNAVNLYLWDAATGKELRELRGPDCHLLRAHFEGKDLLVAGAHANRIYLWEPGRGRQRSLAHGRDGDVIGASLALSPDGKTAVSNGAGTLRFWDVAAGKEIGAVAGVGHVSHFSFSPDGRLLATGCVSSTAVTLWDVAARKTVGSLHGPPMGLATLAFAPDGRAVAAGYLDGRVRLWEVLTRREIRGFEGHEGRPGALAFSPDGRVLASAGTDTTVLLWDVTGRKKGGRLTPPPVAGVEWEGLWARLGDEDPARAHAALWALVAAGERAVGYLDPRLPGRGKADREIPTWIRQLDHAQFAVRERAMKALADLGGRAVPELKEALGGDPTPEVRRRIEQLLAKAPPVAGEVRAALRAVQVLEQIGTAEARRILEGLSGPGQNNPLAREARAALARLGRRR
jgi:RNA polymerase sigma factor (sigma-70 family)